MRWLVMAACLLCVGGRQRSFVATAPSQPQQETSAVSDDRRHHEEPNNADLPQPADDDVMELERLKPMAKSGVAVVKTHSAVFTNVNGHKEETSETKEEVDKDGKMVARVDQVVESHAVEGQQPTMHVRTQLDIPEKGLHKVVEQGPEVIKEQPAKGVQPKDKRRVVLAQHREQPDNGVDQFRSYSGMQYSPLDMAEYVFWTGDEKGVTLAIEEFLQQGLMSQQEAITFLQDIKVNLNYLQNHYAEERQQRQLQAKERAVQMQKAFHLDMREQPMEAVGRVQEEAKRGDLAEVRQRMRDNLIKKSEREEQANMQLQNRQQGGQTSLADEDYEELLERLRVADFLYTEYSLEEVIYQLAKVMFSQSLTRGSTEAQEALQKFTGFLEAEAEQGRISRNLEKKVLDVLIASLTDTLTEHPELVSAAREGLGTNSALQLPTNDQILRQLLILNQGGVDKQGFQDAKQSAIPKGLSHRFQAPTGSAGIAMKKRSSDKGNAKTN